MPATATPVDRRSCASSLAIQLPDLHGADHLRRDGGVTDQQQRRSSTRGASRASRGAEPHVRAGDGRPVEVAVIAILEELLELDGIGLDDNFFELGGHSLMAAQLVARLQNLFGVELTLLVIFDNPTAAGIAAEIERDAGRIEPAAR